MCEFKVVVQKGNDKVKIAEDIVKVFYKNEKLVLMDVLGNKTSVEGAIITNINVSNEKLEILQQSIIGPIIKFLGKISECLQKGIYDLEVEETWKEVKSKGELTIKELKGLSEAK